MSGCGLIHGHFRRILFNLTHLLASWFSRLQYLHCNIVSIGGQVLTAQLMAVQKSCGRQRPRSLMAAAEDVCQIEESGYGLKERQPADDLADSIIGHAA